MCEQVHLFVLCVVEWYFNGPTAVATYSETTSRPETALRICGDEENRTLNPRLANSDQSVRRCRFRSLTCADSSSMIAEYRRCATARQHYWQHSTAVAMNAAHFRPGRIGGVRKALGGC